jgi:hypothetical protein
MAARAFGRIIFVVSRHLWVPPAADLLPYVTSTGALVALARRWPWHTARTAGNLRARRFHDREGFGTASGTKSFTIM